MPGRTIALNGVSVARIGLGTNRLRNTAENHAFLTAAVEAGVGLLDTAHLYAGGESEAAIGAALAPFYDELIVATKGGYHPGEGQPDRLRAQLTQSFERLLSDRISLYYLHRVDPETPLEQSLGLLAEYRDAGRIAHIGISEVTVEQLERARAITPIAAVQNEYNLDERMWDEVVDYCAAEGIVFVPFYPLHGASRPDVREIAGRYDATPQQIALAWLLRRSPTMLPIPGTLSLEHARANLAALDLELTDEDYVELTSLAARAGSSSPTVNGSSSSPTRRIAEQDPGHERSSIDRVVADRQRLALAAEDHLLVGDEAGQAHRVDRLVDVPARLADEVRGPLRGPGGASSFAS